MGVVIGEPLVWGIPERMLPVDNTVGGRVRLRFRNDNFARAFVRTFGRIRQFVLVDRGNHWAIDERFEEGRNVTLEPEHAEERRAV